MAEFKLGRIKFVWKDAWNTSTTYYVDDVVRYGGKTYICVVGHVSNSDFYTDLESSPARWNQMTDGQSWQGDWDTETFYAVNDIVKYGGLLYICNDSHTSAATTTLGLEADQAKWTLFAEGLDWKDDWTTSTRYKVNDLVKYGGYTYVCNTAHTSASTAASGLEADQAKWDEFNQGLEYKTDWATATRYKVNDIVKYGAGLWIATAQHTSGATFQGDIANWAKFVEGVEFENDWDNATVYQVGDIVRYGGNQYVSKTNHSGSIPPTGTTNWDLFSEGFRFQTDWNSATSYKIGDVVRLNGYTYISTADNTNQEPPNITYWERLNSGLFWKGEWIDDIEYKLGDVVRYGVNAYVCIQGHRSEGDDGSTLGPEGGGAANSRPDQDISGTYWNVMNIGTETAVLTTKGDLVYFSGAGPTRLPIGREGQILRAGAEFPEWVSYADTDFVYYVAPTGTDSTAPIWGKSFDKPWKTIRYACEQVLKGPRNPNAQRLLEMNRAFIQRETVEWIDYQIGVGSGIWSAFDYNDAKCQRDIGFIIDRLIHDIGHGGNLKIRAAAQAYVNALNEGPFSTGEDENGTGTYTRLAEEAANDVAAFNYMLTLIEKVLNNEAPAVNYQETNGDNSTAVVDQWFNADLEAEPGVFTTISSLVGIVTTALTDGDSSNIPDRDVPQNLIRIATGQYEETLPIVVPAYTCVQGDELRSSRVSPAGSLIDPSDVYYTATTFDHLESFIGDIVTGASVTPTTGNTETQSQTWPFGDTAESDTVKQLVNVMKWQSEFKTRSMISSSLTDPTGYNSSYLVGYGNARKLIIENKKFVQEEVIAWLAENYPSAKYQKTLTRRDVSYIIDALYYDLTYDGNALSVQAGLAYFDGDDNSQPQISASIKTLTLGAIGYLKSLLQDIALNNTVTGLQETIPQFRGTAGSASAASLIGNNIDDIIAIITDGPTVVGDSVTLTDPTPADGVNSTTALINEYNALEGGDDFDQVKDVVEAYLSTNYSDVDYSVAKARRDAGIVLKAIGFDIMFNSSYQTVKAAMAYLRPTASELFDRDDRIKEATRNSLIAARDEVLSILSDSTAESRATALYRIVDDIIFGGSNEGSICQTESRNRDWACLQLEYNRDFIKAEVAAYMADTFVDVATNTATSTNLITVSDTSWLKVGTAVRFSGTPFGSLETDRTYYVFDIVSSTEFSISATRYSATNVLLTTDTGSMTVELYYNSALCQRDVDTYIDALKYDLKWPGNYKSRYVATYYANAVMGSYEENMYLLRDATGVRDQTVEGLSGDLTPENEYGTSRPTAGAYASLDPGWGPDDFTVWIITRSPYVQGVTTFGTACIGQKIDGALHAGGNDSIVSNDFTQVISDGIGAWVANNGRAELVSVFTYYAHIGYLSTEGGRIRGTNGNNSYGDFGSVAEGFDSTEAPGTAVVDNRFQFKSVVSNVFTNGANLLRYEFEHCGNEYTEATWTVTGGGSGAEVLQDEFRDDGVFQVRLLDFGTDSTGQYGGDGYLTNANTAQGGSSTSITIAATDGESSTAYIGMKIIITGGTGVGQIGIIDTYNSGTKLATVTKESTGAAGWDHMIPGTSITSPDASSTYVIEPRLTFTSPVTSSVAGTFTTPRLYSDVVYGNTSGYYIELEPDTYTGSGIGASFDVIRNGTKYASVSINTPGTGYSRLETITIDGSNLGGVTSTNDIVITITAIDSDTGEILAFDFDGVGSGGRWVASSSGYHAYSTNGTTWTEVSTSFGGGTIGHGMIDDGSSQQKISRFVVMNRASSSNQTSYSEDGITWAAASSLGVSNVWRDIAFGNGRFVGVGSDNTNVAISLDGEVWDLSGAYMPNAGYTSITYGKGIFVAVRSGTTEVATSEDGITWATSTLPASSAWTSVTFGNNMFVAVASDSESGAYSLNGTNWTAMSIGSADDSTVAGYRKVSYAQGLFVAVATSGAQQYHYIAKSENGIIWSFDGVETSTADSEGFADIAFGNPSQTGYWVALEYSDPTGAGTVNGISRVRTGATAKARAVVDTEKIILIKITEPGSGYDSAPTLTITDPNNIYEAPTSVRIGKGAMANPTFINRGTGYTTGSAEIDTGDGYADFYQPGSYVAVRRLTSRPVAGSNVVFENIPGITYKLVSVVTFIGAYDGSYTAFFQVSPQISIADAPEHLDGTSTRIRYSQVRLTGHDFLNIGTGNFVESNYPGTPIQNPIPANETVESNGGRVFFTSTDQDGNFRVGDLFSVEQATGVATLNADAFNISGLQELSLGNLTLGGGSATITEFSTDPFFTANSDSILPTQRAIKAYIANQIGGGGAALNVNSVTAGSIFISGNTIAHVADGVIRMTATFDFAKGVKGIPLAFNYFLA